MKISSCLSGVGLLALLVPGLLLSQVPPPEVSSAAEAGRVSFLTEVLPPEELVNFGFEPGEDVSATLLGDPWPLYTITPGDLKAATAQTPVEDLVTPTGLWYFPVLLDGRPRCIITVASMEGKWEAVGIGKAPLAGELAKIDGQWPKKSGYTPRLVAVYQATAYFFTVPELDPGNLTPLTFDGVGFGGYRQKAGPEYSAPAELSELLAPLKESVEANISAPGTSGEGGEE